MTRLDLNGELEQPTPPVGFKRWLKDNVAIAMLLVWCVGQIYTGTNWFHDRESSELAAKREVESLRLELDKVPEVYVRQDVLNQVLRRIDDHLASIDNKLSQQGVR